MDDQVFVDLVSGPPLEHPWSSRRRLESAAAGVVFNLPVTQSLSLLSRHQIARTKAHTILDLRTVPGLKLVRAHAARNWGYQPGLGLRWHPAAIRRLDLSVEAVNASVSGAKAVSTFASARLVF